MAIMTSTENPQLWAEKLR